MTSGLCSASVPLCTFTRPLYMLMTRTVIPRIPLTRGDGRDAGGAASPGSMLSGKFLAVARFALLQLIADGD